MLSALKRIVRRGLVDPREEKRSWSTSAVAQLRIKTDSIEQAAGTLSGGNQQKVVLAKLLATEARILLFFDPTRGVDVGTKAEIFALMRDLAARGFAILFFSTDLASSPMSPTARMVMSYGRIAAVLEGDEMTEGRDPARHAVAEGGRMNRSLTLLRRHVWVAPLLVLMLLIAVIGTLRPGSFAIDQINIKIAAAMTLILIATGQTIVVMRGGIDLSVGGDAQPRDRHLRRRAAIPACVESLHVDRLHPGHRSRRSASLNGG